MMNYCPSWVFEVTCAAASIDFLDKNVGITAVSGSFQSELNKHYVGVTAEEISAFVEGTVRFLDEVDAGEKAVELLRGFIHYRINFEMPNKPRKLKGLFSAADSPEKTRDYSAERAIKSFRAYVYSLKNEVVELAPAAWKLSDVEGSVVLRALSKIDTNPLDFL